jgi:hypothetical protein
MSPRFDVLACNGEYARGYGFGGGGPELQHNLLWRCFKDESCRRLFVDWEQTARCVVAKFRMRYAEYFGDPTFEELVHRLSSCSGAFALMWSDMQVASPTESMKSEILHPSLGRVLYEIVALPVPDDPGQAVVLHLPGSPL